MERDAGRNLMAAGIVALGLTLAGAFVGGGFALSRVPDRFVTVRGLAERDVVADVATWQIVLQGSGLDFAAVERKLERDAGVVTAFLGAHGVQGDEIQPRGVSVSQYVDSRQQLQTTIRRRILVRTNDVAKMEAAFADQARLVRDGVVFDNETGGARYFFTGLNKVKPAMIADATKAARDAADQFARDSKTGVGAIRRATQGVFEITGRDGTPGDGADSPMKKLRVVTTVEFALK